MNGNFNMFLDEITAEIRGIFSKSDLFAVFFLFYFMFARQINFTYVKLYLQNAQNQTIIKQKLKETICLEFFRMWY